MSVPNVNSQWVTLYGVDISYDTNILVNTIGGVTLDIDPFVLLLGITENLPVNKHTKLFVFYTAYLC